MSANPSQPSTLTVEAVPPRLWFYTVTFVALVGASIIAMFAKFVGDTSPAYLAVVLIIGVLMLAGRVGDVLLRRRSSDTSADA